MTARSLLLLRAVNLGARNRVPMAELSAVLAERTALGTIRTYIASGNVIVDTPPDPARACREVREIIREVFDVDTPVIHRSRAALLAARDANPFTDAASDQRLHVMFLEAPADPAALDALTPRLVDGERIALVGDDLWIDYGPGGVHATKLSKAVLDRALGVAGTARNLRTLEALIERSA